MNIEKLINTFETLAYNVFAEDDFNKKNEIEEKIELLVDKVYAQGLEQSFYNKLFNSPKLFARIEIALISSCRNYDLYSSLEILEKTKKEAHSLKFFDDDRKNKKWQSYFSKFTDVKLKEKIAFFEELNDEFLFKKYYECISLYGQYYNGYLLSKKLVMQETKGKIVLLLNCVNDAEKLNLFFVLLFKKAEQNKSLINYILTNYFSWVMKLNPEVAINNLRNIVQEHSSKLNPKILMFVKDKLNEMVT